MSVSDEQGDGAGEPRTPWQQAQGINPTWDQGSGQPEQNQVMYGAEPAPDGPQALGEESGRQPEQTAQAKGARDVGKRDDLSSVPVRPRMPWLDRDMSRRGAIGAGLASLLAGFILGATAADQVVKPENHSGSAPEQIEEAINNLVKQIRTIDPDAINPAYASEISSMLNQGVSTPGPYSDTVEGMINYVLARIAPPETQRKISSKLTRPKTGSAQIDPIAGAVLIAGSAVQGLGPVTERDAYMIQLICQDMSTGKIPFSIAQSYISGLTVPSSPPPAQVQSRGQSQGADVGEPGEQRAQELAAKVDLTGKGVRNAGNTVLGAPGAGEPRAL